MWPQIKRKQACFYDLSTCFGVFSASALRHFVFSGGLRPFWDFLAFERPDGLSQAKKSQKGLRPPEKTKCLQASAENTPKKVDSSWKNACFLFIFGPISYWRAFFHDTIHTVLISRNFYYGGIFVIGVQTFRALVFNWWSSFCNGLDMTTTNWFEV